MANSAYASAKASIYTSRRAQPNPQLALLKEEEGVQDLRAPDEAHPAPLFHGSAFCAAPRGGQGWHGLMALNSLPSPAR